MKERNLLIIKLILSHIIFVPCLILSSLLIKSDASLLISISQTILMILYLTGYWEFFGSKFKLLYSVSVEILLLTCLSWKIFSNTNSEWNVYLITSLGLIQLYLLTELFKVLIVIFRQDKNSSEIEFPFKNGNYLITDGGNSRVSRIMNYHFYSKVHKRNKTNNSMLFATDIVKINSSSKRFLPPENSDYPVFGERVYSPVSGVVIKTENTIEDNIPYCGDYPYNTGNTIVIRNDNRYVLLGHLKKGSVIVKPGQMITAGDIVAESGNSGYSERPHIHIQYIESNSENYWKGTGIPITFKRKNLFKNRLVRIL